MDLWIERNIQNYQKLEKGYAEFGALIFPQEQFFNENFNVWGIGRQLSKIEIITQVEGLKFRESFKKWNYFKVEKLKVSYIDFDDLLTNKLATGRYKDLAEIEQLKKRKKE